MFGNPQELRQVLRNWKTANWFVQRYGFLTSKEEEKVRGLRAVAGGRQLFRVPSNDASPLGIHIHVIGRMITDGPWEILFCTERSGALAELRNHRMGVRWNW
jgi:hypothetical protein